MVNIAIVDDEAFFSDMLKGYIKKYSEENDAIFNIKVYNNALILIEKYLAEFDIIFMDIKMPYINGMDAARKIRDFDKSVILIFVTEMVQFAVNGYEVNALDYIVKPIK